ncbi:hypothetical protein WJX81_004765 [Elliptochloris bilobata]|uniref:TMEM205-like domain-containing protein n=1 Tax=Elliptochloris bilobata TaxID=381761 RepID=A0AAW1S118_9CHLO
MLDPSLANKNQVRLLAVAVAVLLTARSMEFWSGQVARSVHLLAYGTWLGSLVWTTFVAGITMFKNLPRQVFGRLQAKLFPLYFLLAIACITLQVGTLAFGPGSGLAHKQLVTLGIALVASLANGFVVEPKATESMLKRYQLENDDAKDAERIKALRSEFGKLHGLSSTLNLAALVAAVSHGWWLASRMVLSAA